MGAAHGHRCGPEGARTAHTFPEAPGSEITSSVEPFMVSSNIGAARSGLPGYFLHCSALVLNSVMLHVIAT